MFFLVNGEGQPGVEILRNLLLEGAHRLHAAEEALRLVEDDESIHSVGRGGMPNICGVVQCDASILDGETLQCGSAGALERFPHAISVARKVMERLPHVFLVGEGAARFAREVGFHEAPMLSEHARTQWRKWLDDVAPKDFDPNDVSHPLIPYLGGNIEAHRPKDTVIALVRDRTGEWASATSTSGWDFKYPGRLGDSPIVGAGHYCDSRWGAAACTHTGEMAIRTCASFAIVSLMKRGASPQEACHEIMEELLRLSHGHLGEIALYAVSAMEEHFVLSSGVSAPYYHWKDGERTINKSYGALVQSAGRDEYRDHRYNMGIGHRALHRV